MPISGRQPETIGAPQDKGAQHPVSGWRAPNISSMLRPARQQAAHRENSAAACARARPNPRRALAYAQALEMCRMMQATLRASCLACPGLNGPQTLLAHISLIPPTLPYWIPPLRLCLSARGAPASLKAADAASWSCPSRADQFQPAHEAAAHRSMEAADARRGQLSPRAAARSSTEAAEAADVRPPAHAQMSTDAADAADLRPGARRLPRMARTCTNGNSPLGLGKHGRPCRHDCLTDQTHAHQAQSHMRTCCKKMLLVELASPKSL